MVTKFGHFADIQMRHLSPQFRAENKVASSLPRPERRTTDSETSVADDTSLLVSHMNKMQSESGGEGGWRGHARSHS